MCSNNEILRAQRLGSEHLVTMKGLEFFLAQSPSIVQHAPTLFVIRKQFRHSPTFLDVLQV